MPTLAEYRDPVLEAHGGILGVLRGTVDVDPDLGDLDAARSLISGKLFDAEKLSNAYGGHYAWIPRYSDSRRVEDHGFRVRYTITFEPPIDGGYQIRFYGYGQTRELAAGTPLATLTTAIRQIHEDLADVTVTALSGDPPALQIALPSRIGVGTTAGRLTSQGGVGIALVARDFSQPLVRGLDWLLSPTIPFETEDQILGLHACINQALYDIKIPDLFPVSPSDPVSSRVRTVQVWDLAPWLQPDMVVGYYAPTEWRMVATFMPPASGVYTLALATSLTYGPNAVPLAYNATGAQIEAALRSIGGLPPQASAASIAVSPQGAASVYTITWQTQHHAAQLIPSAGLVTARRSIRLRDPYPLTLLPNYQEDYETPTLSDPGYLEGSSWFVQVMRPGNARICPQTYPRKANGQLDTSRPPIAGDEWLESSAGLVNDLDQAYPPVGQVTMAALRNAVEAIAQAAPRGEKAEWQQAGQTIAASAATAIYGPIRQRPARRQRPLWPGPGPTSKGADFWIN